jgi:hypothetical protein
MAKPAFPNDPRMQALHEECEKKAAAYREEEYRLRLAEWERQMVTGAPDPGRKRILELMEQYRPQAEAAMFRLTEQQIQDLIDETERIMLGLPLPGAIDGLKIQPEGELRAVLRPDKKKLRTFVVLHGRAPNEEELRELLRL